VVTDSGLELPLTPGIDSFTPPRQYYNWTVSLLLLSDTYVYIKADYYYYDDDDDDHQGGGGGGGSTKKARSIPIYSPEVAIESATPSFFSSSSSSSSSNFSSFTNSGDDDGSSSSSAPEHTTKLYHQTMARICELLNGKGVLSRRQRRRTTKYRRTRGRR